MAITDLQTDARIAQLVAGYEERVQIAQLAATTLAVEMAAALDPAAKTSFAHQILAQQRDIEVLTAAAGELGRLANKPNSAGKLRQAATAAVAAAQAVVVVGTVTTIAPAQEAPLSVSGPAPA